MNAALRSFTAMGFLFLMAPSSSPVAAQDRPLIGVRFRIEAPDFRRNLYKSIPSIERDLAESLARLGREEFGFLGWQRFGDIQDPSRIAAVLSVSLTAEEPKSLGWDIWLRFSAEAGPAGSIYQCQSEKRVPPTFPKVNDRAKRKLDRRLFSPMDPQPTGDAKTLKARIEEILFKEPGFQTALLDAFLGEIPFCREARPHLGSLLEIRVQQDLALGLGSKMTLRLCSRIRGAREASLLELTANDTGVFPDTDQDSSWLQAGVSRCIVRGAEKQPDACIPEISRLFQDPLAEDLFMILFNNGYPRIRGKRVSMPAKG
jgi:hypothetical protein